MTFCASSSLVECVPNFSEGVDSRVIEQICSSIEQVPQTQILHVDMGKDANRTVITYVASVETAVDAGFSAIKTASELIDMQTQRGAHRRMGATDVFPLIPLRNTDFSTCIRLAHTLGKRVSNELVIPVFLYGKAARFPSRIRVPDIRKNGYETLRTRIKTPNFTPDFGEAKISIRSGATIIGVRDFLLAYNVNLTTTSVETAKQIAKILRSSGYIKRDDQGRIIRNSHGKKVRINGRLIGCQADGWLMPTYGHAQVTMNLLDHHATGLHTAYEAVKKEAHRHGIDVAGSELVGMVPQVAIDNAGLFYNAEGDPVANAVAGLGLDSVVPFDPDQKIIERVLRL